MARVYHWDLPSTIKRLAHHTSEWSWVGDAKHHRCIVYVKTTEMIDMRSFANDQNHLCSVAVFSDADFASDATSNKSTTGGYISVMGPNTWAPTAGSCKI